MRARARESTDDFVGYCVVGTVVYCLRWSVVGSELSVKMFSVYDSDFLLPVDVT